MGKTHYKWPFSIAMLNYQRVVYHSVTNQNIGFKREPMGNLLVTGSVFFDRNRLIFPAVLFLQEEIGKLSQIWVGS